METEASKRDDMEALGYVLIFFLRGNLPWLYDPSNFAGIDKIELFFFKLGSSGFFYLF